MEKKPENCLETNIFTGIFEGFCQVWFNSYLNFCKKHHFLKNTYFCFKKMLKIRIYTSSSNPVNKLDWKSFSLQRKSVNFQKSLPNSLLYFTRHLIYKFFIWIHQHILLQVWEKLVMVAMFFDSELIYLLLFHIFSNLYW